MQDVIQRPELAYLVVLAGVIALPASSLRRHCSLAASAFAIGTAALPAGPHPVTAGFLLIAILGALACGFRAGPRGAPLGLGGAVATWASRGFLASTGWGSSLVGAVAVAASAAPLLWLRGLLPTMPAPRLRSIRPMTVGILALFLSPMLLAPHLSLVFLGAAGASWAVWLTAPTGERARWPVIPALVTIVLLAGYLFMATVAGPEGLAMSGLADLPFSPAAETPLAAALLIASWLSSGLWPLHRWGSAPLLAPVAALLLVRVGLVASPAGMEHWRALAAPLAMLGIWHAAAARWAPGLSVGAAWLALTTGGASGIAAAAWLLPSALALEFVGPEAEGERWPRRWGRDLALFYAGWGGFLALRAGLHGEVVYSVLSAAGAAIGISGGPRQAMTPSEPRSTLPSA